MTIGSTTPSPTPSNGIDPDTRSSPAQSSVPANAAQCSLALGQNPGSAVGGTMCALEHQSVAENVRQCLGAAITVVPEYQNALFAAARRGDAECVQFFLSLGRGCVDPHGRNAYGKTFAQVATEHGYPEIAALLTPPDPPRDAGVSAAPKKPHIPGGDDSLATHGSAGVGDPHDLRTSPEGKLYAAILDGDHRAFVTQIDRVGDINAPLHKGDNALHLATWQGHATMVELLVAKPGVDINRASQHPDYPGYTALHFAAVQSHAEIVGVLAKAPGLLANLKNREGDTALHIAAYSGYANVVQELTKLEGIDLAVACSHPDFTGKTALQLAVMQGNSNLQIKPDGHVDFEEVVKRLLETRRCGHDEIKVARDALPSRKRSRIWCLLEKALEDQSAETTVAAGRTELLGSSARRPGLRRR